MATLIQRSLKNRIRLSVLLTAVLLSLTASLLLARPPRAPEGLPRPGHFSDFLYLTNFEQSRFGEFIWFFWMDTIRGPVFSNRDIGVHNGAVFFDLVSTVGRIRDPMGSTFHRGYYEHVSPIAFHATAERLRSAAADSGHWLNTQNRRYTFGLDFRGTIASVWRWETGTHSPFGDSTRVMTVISWTTDRVNAFFCDGGLWIKGYIEGRAGIGAAGNLRLMDNITTSDARQMPYLIPLTSSNMITLISEAPEPPVNDRAASWTGILIANTPTNGREGGRDRFSPSQQEGRDIAICAQLIALRSSFTFEDQNDLWDPYICPSPPTNDERGTIYLHGSTVQFRCGYVHRSNRSGTGYAKAYRYDERFRTTPPPFSPEIPAGHIVPPGGR